MIRIRRYIAWVAVVLGGVWCGWAALSHYLRWREAGYEDPDSADWRAAARVVSGRDVGLACLNAEDLDPHERCRLIAVNWELGIRPANPVAQDEPGQWPDTVIGSSYSGRRTRARYAKAGYSCIYANKQAAVWSRQQGAVVPQQELPARKWRELAGVATVLLLMIALVMRCSRTGLRAFALVVSGLVFWIVSLSALSHPLLPPNGLGVYAGKAKLMMEAGGMPPGFWTDAAFAPYQPSYPPGLTLLSLLTFACAGSAGDLYIQFLMPGVFALLFYLMVADSRKAAVWIMALALVLSPVAQDMSAGFNAEPFAAVCLVVGLRRILVVKDWRGWLWIGFAGLFRHEGLLLATGLSLFLSEGRWMNRLRAVAGAAGPGLLWQLFMVGVGAGLYDYDWAAGPGLERIGEAAGVVWSLCTTRAGETGCAVLWTIGVAIWALAEHRGSRHVRLLGFGLVAVLAGVVLLGFCTSPHYSWIAEATLPRYLWLAFVPVLAVAGMPDGCDIMMAHETCGDETRTGS